MSIGDEGFGLAYPPNPYDYPYTTGPGLNFTVNLAIPTIDFGTIHLYPGSWGETADPGGCKSWLLIARSTRY